MPPPAIDLHPTRNPSGRVAGRAAEAAARLLVRAAGARHDPAVRRDGPHGGARLEQRGVVGVEARPEAVDDPELGRGHAPAQALDLRRAVGRVGPGLHLDDVLGARRFARVEAQQEAQRERKGYGETESEDDRKLSHSVAPLLWGVSSSGS
jgi:hypothetical protein